MTGREFNRCIRRIREGDPAGLRAIYDAYDAYIFMIMKSIVGSRETAEDLTADFFIRLWSLAADYKARETHKGWMAVIARNMALDRLKKEGRELPCEAPEAEISLQGAAPSAEDEALSDMAFGEMISGLPAAEQEILALKFEGGLTFKEIAAVTGLPMGTVTWKYQRSIEKLRRAM